MTTRRTSSRSLAIAAGAIALLGISAYVVRRKTQRVEAENPPQGRFIEVQGVRLHFTEHGDASSPPLVLLHGNGANSIEMELSGLVERAARRYRVLVFDRPGYGYSERPEGRLYTPADQAGLLLDALQQLGVERPIVLGHSWGAMVATEMGIARPEALRALVLVSGYYTPSARLDVLWESAPAIPVLGALLRNTVSPLLGRLLWPLLVRRIFWPAPTAPAFKERYPIWMSLRPKQLQASAAEAAMMIPESVRLVRRVAEIQLPVVIVAGASDVLLLTAWQSRRLHGRMPASRLHVVPHAGHMVHHTAPDAVLDAIDEAAGIAPGAIPLRFADAEALAG